MEASTSSASPAERHALELSAARNGDAQASTSAKALSDSPVKKPSNVLYEYSEGGGKGDLKKRRRMRYYILLDPGEEERKPWLCIAICAALIVCLAVGIVLIVVFTQLRPDGGANDRGNVGDSDTLISPEAKIVRIASCPQLATLFGDSVASLNPDVEGERFSHWFADDQAGRPPSPSIVDGGNTARQDDILAPLPSATPPEEHYAAAGSLLKVIAAGDGDGANVTVTHTLDLLAFDGAPAAERKIALSRVGPPASVEVPCGLRETFRARTLLLPPAPARHRPGAGRRRLVVVGSSIECIGVHSTLPEYSALGAPRVRLGPRFVQGVPQSRADDEWSNPVIRPFPSTLAIVVEVGGGAAPRVLSAVQYEGDFERVHLEGDRFAWLFVSQATHQPVAPAGGPGDEAAARQLGAVTDGQVMPVYRTRVRSGGMNGPWEAWGAFRPVGGCKDVRAMGLPGLPRHDRQLLTVAPLPLTGEDVGVVQPAQHSLFVVSWDTKGQRVLSADDDDGRDVTVRAWLFQTFENPEAPGPASADTPLPPAAPADAAATATIAPRPVESTYATAIAAFSLRDGVLDTNETGLTEVLGEPFFRGAAQYDAQQRGLVVLSTLRLDAARDSRDDSTIRGSMLHLLDRRTLKPLLRSTKLLMKKREPKSMLLGARPAEGQARKAFVALSSLFSTQRQQQIQLIQYLPPLDEASAPAAAAAGTAPPASADDAVNSFEIVVNETVHLMKSFRLGGGQKEWLLVAGKLRKENDADSTDELQFSIYATTKDDRKAQQVVTITGVHGESEAFFDDYAARLFPSREDARYFALPVVRTRVIPSKSTEAFKVDCLITRGGSFGGTYVWTIDDGGGGGGDDGGVRATPLAAVPDIGTCGRSGPQCAPFPGTNPPTPAPVPVKRVQFLDGPPQRLLTVSACAASVATLPPPGTSQGETNETMPAPNVHQETAHAPLFGCDCMGPP